MPLSPVTPSVVGAAQLGYRSVITQAAVPELISPNTWERWRPQSASTTMLSNGGATVCDYIAIGAHTCAGVSLTVRTSETFGGSMVDRYSQTPDNNSPIIIDLANVTVYEMEIEVGGACEIGIVYAGTLLDMERPIYGGHAPLALNKKTTYQSNMSESGQFLGRQIIRKGSEAEFSWSNLTADWVRNTLSDFIESARAMPFFIRWRPDIYSSEVSFGHTVGDIRALNQGGGTDLMSVRMKMRAHSDL